MKKWIWMLAVLAGCKPESTPSLNSEVLYQSSMTIVGPIKNNCREYTVAGMNGQELYDEDGHRIKGNTVTLVDEGCGGPIK